VWFVGESGKCGGGFFDDGHRIHTALPWAASQGVSTHWLRHTTLTWVERHFGYGVARGYAGHTDRAGGSTTTYIRQRAS